MTLRLQILQVWIPKLFLVSVPSSVAQPPMPLFLLVHWKFLRLPELMLIYSMYCTMVNRSLSTAPEDYSIFSLVKSNNASSAFACASNKKTALHVVCGIRYNGATELVLLPMVLQCKFLPMLVIERVRVLLLRQVLRVLACYVQSFSLEDAPFFLLNRSSLRTMLRSSRRLPTLRSWVKLS